MSQACFIACGLHRCTAQGSNLALMVELMAGPLVGAAVADKLAEKNWGNLVLALDPGLLGNAEDIKSKMQVRWCMRMDGWIHMRGVVWQGWPLATPSGGSICSA